MINQNSIEFKKFMHAIHSQDSMRIADATSLAFNLPRNLNEMTDQALQDEKEILMFILKSLILYKQTDIFIYILRNKISFMQELAIPIAELLFYAIGYSNTRCIDVLVEVATENIFYEFEDMFAKDNYVSHQCIKCDAATYYTVAKHLAKINYHVKNAVIFNIDKYLIVTKAKTIAINANNATEAFKQSYGKKITQNQFTNYGKIISLLICNAFKNKKFSLSLENSNNNEYLTLFRLGVYRADLAACSSGFAAKFGMPRLSDSYTPFISEHYKKFMREFVDTILPYENQNLEVTYYPLFELGQVAVKAQFYVEVNNQKIPLTRIDLDGNTGSKWEHTAFSYIEPLLEHINKLIQAVTFTSIDFADFEAMPRLIRAIAEIHWFLAHAMPFSRGSAAVTEWIVMGLFAFHGLAIEFNAMPDCYALIEPDRARFATRYSGFILIKGMLPTSDNRENNAVLTSIVEPAIYPERMCIVKKVSEKHDMYDDISEVASLLTMSELMKYAIYNRQFMLIDYLLNNPYSTSDELSEAKKNYYSYIPRAKTAAWLVSEINSLANIPSTLFSVNKYIYRNARMLAAEARQQIERATSCTIL